MLARPKPTVARHHMSEPTKSLFRTLSPSPEAPHHAPEPTKSSLKTQSSPPGESNSIMIALQANRDKLSKQHTSGAPLLVRNAVLEDIENLITDVTNKEYFITTTSQATETRPANKLQEQETRFAEMESDITTIKQAIFQSLQEPKSWAQVARKPSTKTPPTRSLPHHNPSSQEAAYSSRITPRTSEAPNHTHRSECPGRSQGATSRCNTRRDHKQMSKCHQCCRW